MLLGAQELEHAPALRAVADRAVEVDLADVRLEKSGADLQKGRLSGTVRPDDRRNLTGVDIKTDITQHSTASVFLGNVTGAQSQDTLGCLLMCVSR